MNIKNISSVLLGKITAAIFIILALYFSYNRTFDIYELKTLDLRYKVRPVPPVSNKLVVIEIGDDTLSQLREWPFNRQYYALVVKALKKAGAEQIIFDIIFSEERRGSEDEELAGAIQEAGNIYLPYVLNLKTIKAGEMPVSGQYDSNLLYGFERVAKATGFINSMADPDGTFRRIMPYIDLNGEVKPQISFKAALDLMGIKDSDISITPGKRVVIKNYGYIPLDEHSSMIINIPGKWNDTFRHYSFVDILGTYLYDTFSESKKNMSDEDMKSLKGSICFIAATSAGIGDVNPSPFETLYPGIGMHMSLYNSILQKNFIRRADRIVNTLILVPLFALAFFSARFTRTRYGIFYIISLIAIFILLAIIVFMTFNYWIDVFYPVTILIFYSAWAFFNKSVFETHRRELLENELSIAKNIQLSFLPKEKPKALGIEIEAEMVTARQVGGDLYDFLEFSGTKTGIMIGDVSGKGVPAALYMAKVVSEFRIFAEDMSPAKSLTSLNNKLSRESSTNLFVTVAYMVFDAENMKAVFSLGGHLPIIMLRQGEAEARLLDSKDGMPLGLMEDCPFTDGIVDIKKGDMFFLYTDGVTEATNPREDMFGQERLVKLIESNRDLDVGKITKLIHKEVNKYEGKGNQHDDITVISIRIV